MQLVVVVVVVVVVVLAATTEVRKVKRFPLSSGGDTLNAPGVKFAVDTMSLWCVQVVWMVVIAGEA